VAHIGAILLALALAACQEPKPIERTHQFSGPVMGTRYRVKVVMDEASSKQIYEIERASTTALENVNSKMSHYLDDSEVSRINTWSQDDPYPISSDTLEVLQHAMEISSTTEGAFDITVAPLVDAWGFGPPGRMPQSPDKTEIDQLLERTGWEMLQVDRASSSISKSRPDLSLDLSAIAKGYAVDKVADALDAQDVEHYMIEVGGEVRTKGRNEQGEPWRIGIERPIPGGDQAIELVVPMSDSSMATSGDYRNYYEVEGERVSHTIDPRSGYPITHSVASVTVVGPLCVRADAYATALLVLGPQGFDLAEELGLAAYFLQRDKEGVFVGRMTHAFKQILEGGESQPAD
jgi:thiamine biosynthesis lipoprotein